MIIPQNCSAKEALLDQASGQVVPLNPLYLGSGCIRDTINGVKVFKCTCKFNDVILYFLHLSTTINNH